MQSPFLFKFISFIQSYNCLCQNTYFSMKVDYVIWNNKSLRMSSLIICCQSLSPSVLGHVVVFPVLSLRMTLNVARNQFLQNAFGNGQCSEGLSTDSYPLASVSEPVCSSFASYSRDTQNTVVLHSDTVSKVFWTLNTLCLHCSFSRLLTT